MYAGGSATTLAGLIGMSQAYISQIEAGLREVDKRSTLVHLAEALQVSVADLTDLPGPNFPEYSAAAATVPAIRAALNLIRLNADVEPTRSSAELSRAVEELAALDMRAQYELLGQKLPDVLLGVYALTEHGPDEQTRTDALRLMVMAAKCGTFTLKYLRYPDLATIASEVGYAAAVRLGHPAWLGVAEFVRLLSLPSENKTLTHELALTAADRLQGNLGSSREAMETYGMLHLSASLVSALCVRPQDAKAHLDEAAEIAARTGEGSFASMYFGPTNICFWRTAIAVELGEGGRVMELAKDVVADQVPSAVRQASYYTDLGRGLAQNRRHDQEAVTNFIRAELIAPQRVRLNQAVRETVGAMLRRTPEACGFVS